jgi:hypothetical protein
VRVLRKRNGVGRRSQEGDGAGEVLLDGGGSFAPFQLREAQLKKE